MVALLSNEQNTTSAWRSELDDRQNKEIDFANLYAADFHHGTDGHNRLLLIATLSGLLDRLEASRQVADKDQR